MLAKYTFYSTQVTDPYSGPVFQRTLYDGTDIYTVYHAYFVTLCCELHRYSQLTGTHHITPVPVYLCS